VTSDRKLRVLLAEDDAICAGFAATAVEQLGHAVVRAETGRAALDLLVREPFDVALLDLGLPELDGLDVARRLRRHERATGASPLVIIALTASDLEETTGRAAGIDAILEKPVRAAVLRETLAACLGARAQTDVEHEAVPVLDLEALSERAGNDDELVRELLGDFLVLSEGSPLEVVAAIDTNEHGVAAGKAHRLRGALLAIGAVVAGRAMGEVEAHASSPSSATEPKRAELAHALRTALTAIDEARAEVGRFLGTAAALDRPRIAS
jgi:CheY-like chemotaxis protein